MKPDRNLYRDKLDKQIREADKKPFLSINVHDGYWIAWFFTIAILGILSPVGHVRFISGLAAGVNLGMGIERFFHLKFKRLIEKSRRQDLIDMRTMSELTENMSYKMLHQIAKNGLN